MGTCFVVSCGRWLDDGLVLAVSVQVLEVRLFVVVDFFCVCYMMVVLVFDEGVVYF